MKFKADKEAMKIANESQVLMKNIKTKLFIGHCLNRVRLEGRSHFL